ncbi:hypothetical protein CGCS363_v009079 [Colletotrichum siamense]|uniref:uncharacterized protein n=1 Tax=Colletotrichum siamense TaxID=690259 RepID=UPI00187278C2|nr:uncharacterized protein CGCS363_v009079 [Colletotrichum siamense]KAF5494468.1 hypothetical protein CGCS363_v009079 [Colletotrichum siamense]
MSRSTSAPDTPKSPAPTRSGPGSPPPTTSCTSRARRRKGRILLRRPRRGRARSSSTDRVFRRFTTAIWRLC